MNERVSDDTVKAQWHRRLIDSMDDGFCVVEVIVNDSDQVIDARYCDMNPAFTRLTGIAGVGEPLASDAVPDLEAKWFERYGDVYQSGKPAFFVDRAEALGRWYEVSLTRIGDKAERRLTCVFKDVTERRQQEEERDLTTRRVHELAAALSESDRRKSEFLATLAHELRNPLAPILNGLELIREFRGEPLEIDRIQAMLTRQVEQMVHLVDDLLDITRISQGSIVLKMESVLLSDVVGAAVESSRHLIKKFGHTLDIELPKKAISIVLDPVRITQVITNLLNNAARYTPSGGHIQIKAIVDDIDVRICIVDNGEGIDEQELRQIFEMFTQIKNPKSSGHGGLGIGLNLSRQLVEMHGGSLHVHSEGLGRGSQFEICLPRNLAVPNEDSPRKATLPHDPQEGTIRILVVDDNQDAANTLARVLSRRGFESSVAYDGQSALNIALKTSPDVIFLDIGLPDITGYQVATEIAKREQRKSMTLVALTGWGAREDVKRSQETGFDHHLTKPVSTHTVLELLSEIAGVRASAK